ncbi:L,D-transpeptidase, partial [Candidatus Falkowbacteria bacterium]|nr:L,D-transpeptidase [Candidatus Falkowbacteria bacterium]
KLGTDIFNVDTDGDGFSDGEEVTNGFDPLSSNKEKISKRIEVVLASQHLAYYFGDVKLEDFAISGGVASMPTPKGEFSVLDKVPSKTYGGTGFDFYYPNTKWNLHFTTDYWRYFIHGAYWHNNFGSPMSHGCVNVRYDQMERLYNFAEVGTKVEIN